MSGEALAPCPFCGSCTVHTVHIRDGRRASCLTCGAAGGHAYYGPINKPDAEERAVANWNRRAGPRIPMPRRRTMPSSRLEMASVFAKGLIETLLNVHALANMARASDNPRIAAEFMSGAADWLPSIESQVASLKRELLREETNDAE